MVDAREMNEALGVDGLQRGERSIGVDSAGDGEAMDRGDPAGSEPFGERLLIEEVGVDLEHRLVRRALGLRVALCGVERVPQALGARGRVEHHCLGGRRRGRRGGLGEVVEQRRQLRVERRQQPREGQVEPARSEIVEESIRRSGGQMDRVAHVADSHARDRELFRAEQRVLDRVDAQLGDGLRGALRLRVKRLDRQDEPVVELDSGGSCGVRSEHIDQRPANRERARIFHHADAHVAGFGEERDQRVAIELGLRSDDHRARRDRFAGRDFACERGDREDEEAPGELLAQMKERAQPVHRSTTIRRDVDERADLVRGEVQDIPNRDVFVRLAGSHRDEVVRDAARLRVVVGDHEAASRRVGFGVPVEKEGGR